ncbi:transcriptional regulator [Plantactinospora sp. GCM10030261]|uniref:transcriptional regulator n=1 Tax=Plantactinospora sp. GCM10030261 TaxID=3273420 RepID=UPI00360FAFA4
MRIGAPWDTDHSDRTRLAAAAGELDTDRVAVLTVTIGRRRGVVALWERVCVPLLRELRGSDGVGVAVEHALSEGIRAGLDRLARTVGRPGAPAGVLLAGADEEAHCLALHALRVALRERGQGSLFLGAAVPWPALRGAARRIRPHTVVVWAQTTRTGRRPPLDALAADCRWARVYGAGPGWSTVVPPVGSAVDGAIPPVGSAVDGAIPPVGSAVDGVLPPASAWLSSLPVALLACRVPGDVNHIRNETVPYR